MKTTLNQIRKHEPCAEGWKKLLTYLGKTEADDEPLSILTILDSNGLDDALWYLRAVEGYDKEIRLFAVWCARQVQHLLKDQRSIDALDVLERYANGEATRSELNAAAEAAWDAWVVASAGAVRAVRAVRAATRSAAAAGDVRDTLWAAMYARTAAEAEADEDAAWDATRASQEAELRRICEELEG